MTTRKLASIQTIVKLDIHPNADKLEIASILGWKAIVKKGEFKEGEQVVYIETDAILPERPEFAFMKDRKYRVKTIKLRNVISQGLVFPLAIVPTHVLGLKDGMDVTEALGITQYDPMASVNITAEAKGLFPGFLFKTDQTRIQSVPNVIKRWLGHTFIVSEKIDGASMSVFFKDGEFGVCSRNLELKETQHNLYWDTARNLNLEEKLRKVGDNVCLQGELLLKNNWYKSPTMPSFSMFDVWDINSGKYIPHSDLSKLSEMYGVQTAPQLFEYTFTSETSVDELIDLATRRSIYNKDKWCEGLVFNSINESYDLELGRLSFKVINPQYLLQTDQ